MSRVFGLEVEPGTKLLLLALADHADDEGNNCWPSVEYLAWKTSLSERHVRRMLSDLRAQGVLIPVDREAGGRHRSVVYRVDLDVLPAQRPFERDRKGISPVEAARGANGHGRGVRPS